MNPRGYAFCYVDNLRRQVIYVRWGLHWLVQLFRWLQVKCHQVVVPDLLDQQYRRGYNEGMTDGYKKRKDEDDRKAGEALKRLKDLGVID